MMAVTLRSRRARVRRPFAGIVLIIVVALAAAGCGGGPPKVVGDVVAAATSIAGEASVRTDHFEGDPDGWLVSVLTEQPEAVSDAVLAVFDGADVTTASDGSKTTVAGTVVIRSDPGDAGDIAMLTVWIPTSALGQDGHLAN